MTANTVTERALSFDCEGHALVGIVHEPTAPAEVGVVVIVGGPQYRAGSHRQFVLLARAIAQAGFAVLRFDSRGMGDGAGEARDFECAGSDVAAAIGALQAQVPGVRRIVLWGLCDGASAALLYLDETHDARVKGLCVLNPWVRSEASLARTHVKHYYRRRLRERAFWVKLISGRVGAEAWRGLMANLRARQADRSAPGLPFQHRMARAWAAFDGDILLVLSGDDYTAKEFVDVTRADAVWAAALRHPRLQRCELPEADHTFSSGRLRRQVNEVTAGWLLGLCGPARSQIRAA